VRLHPGSRTRRGGPVRRHAAGLHAGDRAGSDSPRRSATDSYVEELLDSKQRAAEAELLVAVDQATGTLLGTATFCLPGSPYGEVARPDEGEFRMLGVAKEARGRGVGEALVRTVLRRSHASGLSGVVLSTSTKMRTAHRLYERLGFGRDPERDWYPVPDVALLVYAREV
jgi:ribosomal protein S18 acetylase RimI-like enzyme